MSFEQVMATVTRLTTAAEALAALGARVRADGEGLALDPEIAAALDAVVGELGVDTAGLSAGERVAVAGYARAFLHMASDLADDPRRPPGWAIEDPVVLLSLGRGSAAIAKVIARIAPRLEGLDAALRADGAAFCDVGAGVAALAVALCRTWDGMRVVGLEPWGPSRLLANAEIADAGLGDRIELRPIRVEELADDAAFDAVWLAGPFLSPDALPVALERSHAALKPGGWLLFGAFAAPPDPLAQRVAALRTIRSGGSAAGAEETVERLAAAGFTDVRALERDWETPVGFVAGRRPVDR